jgi:hypothetical protein
MNIGRSEGHPSDNILMEIKGYKFAQNKVCIALAFCTIISLHNNSNCIMF